MGVPLRPQNVSLDRGPDNTRLTRTDVWTNGYPVVIPKGGPGPIDTIHPLINLSGRMPGNGWFPYALPAAPYDLVGPGPTQPNQVQRYGGSSQTWSLAKMREWLTALYGGATR